MTASPYSPEARIARKLGQVVLRLSPEIADRLRQLGATSPGGVSGLVAAWVLREERAADRDPRGLPPPVPLSQEVAR